MQTQRNKTCCFSGHRRLPEEKLDGIIKSLDNAIEALIHQGVTEFISGGALGFDQLGASLVAAKKKKRKNLHLLFALPCKYQDALWSEGQRARYWDLLAKADRITFVSDSYHDGCMKKRNQYMVDRSAYCLCALLYSRSGTGQTVRYARQRGLQVINVASQNTP